MSIYFRTYDDKMIVYITNGNHVVQKMRDGDGREYEYIITQNIFEQIRGELKLWEVKL